MEADREAGRALSREAFPEGRWLSYSELAEIRGIGRPSAVKLARRERWRRIPGNDRDRSVRVLVPPEWLQSSKAVPFREGIPDAIPEFTRQLEAANTRADEAHERADEALALTDRLIAQLTAAGDRADRAEADLWVAEARADADRARADRAEAALAGESQRADALRDRLEGAEAEAAVQTARAGEAEGRAERAGAEVQGARQARDQIMRADEARKARRRLRRAWDVWRGR